MSVDGKLYGLPYFTDIQVFYYNEQMLARAGIDGPPASLDELREQSLELKKAGVAEYPLIFGLKKATWSNVDWWTLVYASGGRLFDDELEPVFPDGDGTALEVLQWMVDAVHTWKIADPAAVELDVNQTRDLFGAGRYAFVMQHRYDESRYNDPKLAAASGQIKMGMIPGLDGATRGTFGIVRMYGLAKHWGTATGARPCSATWAERTRRAATTRPLTGSRSSPWATASGVWTPILRCRLTSASSATRRSSGGSRRSPGSPSCSSRPGAPSGRASTTTGSRLP